MQRLSDFRDRLNEIDGEIVALLGKRLDVCREIGHFKKDQGIPIEHPERMEEVKARSAEQAARHGLDPELARRIFGLIIDEACRLQDRIIAGKDDGAD